MRHVLVYGDSLTWGIVPDSRRRLPFDERWPGVLENKLNESGARVRIIEDGLNGRRTVWDDPFKPGRNGLAGIQQRMEIHSPLSLVILMLGTNDFQFCHPLTMPPWRRRASRLWFSTSASRRSSRGCPCLRS
jgi:lysophospholipase L1-like esterase